MTAPLVCPLCATVVAMTRTYQETGGGDGRRVFQVVCGNHPHAALIVTTLGPHGYPQPSDEFKTDEEAAAAAVGAWRALS